MKDTTKRVSVLYWLFFFWVILCCDAAFILKKNKVRTMFSMRKVTTVTKGTFPLHEMFAQGNFIKFIWFGCRSSCHCRTTPRTRTPRTTILGCSLHLGESQCKIGNGR